MNASVLRIVLAVLAAVSAAVAAATWVLADSAMVRLPAAVLLLSLIALVVVWLAWRVVRWFLWRVGRRLALSYLLIGVLPIPMVLLLGALIGYLLAGYFMGTLYRAAADELQADLDRRAFVALDAFERGMPTEGPTFADVALYRDGRRVAGDLRAPERWPEAPIEHGGYYQLDDDSLAMVGTAYRDGLGTITLPELPTGRALTSRSGIWIEVLAPGEENSGSTFNLQFGESQVAVRTKAGREAMADRRRFFGLSSSAEETETTTGPSEGRRPLRHRPVLWWSETVGSAHRLASGTSLDGSLAITMNATPALVLGRLMAGSPEVNAHVWAGLFGATGLLTSLYSLALLMALFMIVSLSRAVNRLSRATEAIQAGDFSTRIPVRRNDQLGDLHRSFNDMAANLQSLVATAAQKELIDKELQIARDLQRSLLPASLPRLADLRFATLFEPSAAIGGDYYDVLSLADGRIGIVVADVSGHGLPTGLHMAMVKSALQVLVTDTETPREILRRLHGVVQAERQSRFFVTATLAVLDLDEGSVDLINAGHPPTYLVRNGAVEEIVLPGNPLGAIEPRFGERHLTLEPGDTLVWLSDGLVEARDADDVPFGYDGVRRAIERAGADPEAIRDDLVRAVESHAGARLADDDRTLVAVAYRPAEGVSDDSPGAMPSRS